MFDLTALEDAARLVHATMPPTPQFAWPLLAARTGCEVWVKHENHTPIGAYKARNGIVFIDGLRRRRPEIRGIVTATRGNHGQSLPFAARGTGLAVTVVVPQGNSVEKNAAMRAFGAELVEHGRDFDEAYGHARHLAGERGLEMAPAFHPRPDARRRHLCAGAVPGGGRSRHRLCADRHGVGHLRPDPHPRPAGPEDPDRRRGLDRGAGDGAVARGRAGGDDRDRKRPSPTAWPAGCRTRRPSPSSGPVPSASCG